jgi:hypothetical protein
MANTTQTWEGQKSGWGFNASHISFARGMAGALGLVFLVVGIMGFVSPGFLNAHLSFAHNIVHLVSGALALYFATVGSLAATRLFNGVFGTIYFLLGLIGFVLGSPGAAAVGHTAHDSRLLKVIPNVLELGTMDHLIHVVVGMLFVIGSINVSSRVRR